MDIMASAGARYSYCLRRFSDSSTIMIIVRLKKSQKLSSKTRMKSICKPTKLASWHMGLFMLTRVPTHCEIPHDAAAKHLFCKSMWSGPSPWHPAQLVMAHLTCTSCFCAMVNEGSTRDCTTPESRFRRTF